MYSTLTNDDKQYTAVYMMYKYKLHLNAQVHHTGLPEGGHSCTSTATDTE